MQIYQKNVFYNSIVDGEFPDLDIKNLERTQPDDLAFSKDIKKVEFYSKLTGNSDTRGGGCGDYPIPVADFTWTVENEEGITMRQVTEAIYRLKGSKYDFWYELFSGLKMTSKDPLRILVDFDYGS